MMIRINEYNFPSSLFVTPEHLYFRPIKNRGDHEDDIFICGLDDYIQQNIGLVRYVNFPNEDKNIFEKGSTLFSVETEKWVGYFVAPFTIRVVQRNKDLLEKPSLINEDCYNKGWILRVSLTQNASEKLNTLFYQKRLIDWIEKEIAADIMDRQVS